MLSDIGIEVHNIQSLLTKSSSLGVISCLEDIYKRRQNSVLIGRIEKLHSLIKKSELCTRHHLKVVLKEVRPDGNYGQYFLAVFFNTIAVEIDSAKFSIGDKLVFVEPQVFVNPAYRPKNTLHRLHIQIGLIGGHPETVWFARKFGQGMKLTQGSATPSKSNENRTPSKRTAASNSLSLIKDVTKREEVDETKTHIQKLNDKQSPDGMDLDKSCSDCFVLLEDIKVSPQSSVNNSNDNNNKENMPVDVPKKLESESSSVIMNSRTVQIHEVTVNEHLNASTENADKPSVLYADTVQEDAINMGQQKHGLDRYRENESSQKYSESPSWIQEGAKRLKESPGKSLRTIACDNKTPSKENSKQNGILTVDKKWLQAPTSSKKKEITSSKETNKQIEKLLSPSNSNSGTGEFNKGYGEYIIGPEQYDEKLFQNPSVILKDVAISKYTDFIKDNLLAENDNNNTPEKKMIVSPREIKKNENCCQLSADDSEDSDRTIDLEGLLISRKNCRVTKRKLLSPGKRQDLLLNEQQQCSTVLSLFEDSEDDEKEISSAHGCDMLNKGSVLQNSTCSVGKNITVIEKNNNISRTTKAAAELGIINDNNEVVEDVAKTLNKLTRDHCSCKDDDDDDNNKSIIEVIYERASNEVAELKINNKNGGTSPVLSTRCTPKPQQKLIKSHDATASSSTVSRNIVDVNCEESEIYITGLKRKTSEASVKSVGASKMTRFNSAEPRRKNSCMMRIPTQMVLEDDMCNRLTGISPTGNNGMPHQFIEETCKFSVITGFLVDILPRALDTCDLIIGHCMTNCGVHRHSKLAFFKHEDTEEPHCPECFKQGIERKVQLMFMFNVTVMTADGNCSSLLVFDQHAEHFLGCSFREYLANKAKRIQIRDTLESYMLNPTSGRTNAPEMRFCVCKVNNIEILVKDVTSSSIDYI